MRKENAPGPKAEGAICLLPGDNRDDSTAPTPAQFPTPRAAALALLMSGERLTRKAGSFLGQTCVDPTPLTPAQVDWLATLLERAELPPLGGAA